MSELIQESLRNNSVLPLIDGNIVSTVYPEKNNVTKQAELINYTTRDKLAVPNTNFGSSSQIRIPSSYHFLGMIALKVRLSATFIAKSDYVAYSLIKSIRWQVGSTKEIIISGANLLQLVLEQCDSKEKKEMVLQLSGRQAYTKTDGTKTPVVLAASASSYIAHLPLPFSTISTKTKFPFPNYLTKNVSDSLLTIEWKNLNECAKAGVIELAEIIFEHAKLSDSRALKMTSIKYPFIRNTTLYKDLLIGATSLDLNGFEKGEINSILFHRIDTVDLDATKTSYSTYKGLPIQDLSVSFNGQYILRHEDDASDYFNMKNNTNDLTYFDEVRYLTNPTEKDKPIVGESIGAITMFKVIQKQTGTSYRNESLTGKYRYYKLDLSEKSAMKQHKEFKAGGDLSNNSLKFEFKALTTASRWYFTICYKSIYHLSKDGVLLIN